MEEERLNQILNLKRAMVTARTAKKVLSGACLKMPLDFQSLRLALEDGGLEVIPDNHIEKFLNECLEYTNKEVEITENAFKDI